MSKPSFWQTVKRNVIYADFKPNDSVLEVAYMGVTSHSSTKKYLQSGKLERFFDRLWRFLVMLMFGFVVVIIVAGWPAILEEGGVWLALAAAALGVYSLWMVLISQGWLRWMHRHRKDPRK